MKGRWRQVEVSGSRLRLVKVGGGEWRWVNGLVLPIMGGISMQWYQN